MPSEKIISVVAGGWSVGQLDLSRIPGFIIAINDAAIHLPRLDLVVSMDRLWMEHRYAQLRVMMRPALIRRSALANIRDKWPWLRSFECDHTSMVFAEAEGFLNGTNSGMCGFNRAYQLLAAPKPSDGGRPAKQILLFGFDMKHGPSGESYWYPPYPWRPNGATKPGKYREWSKQFERAAKQCAAAGIDVAVVGDSAIDCFRRVQVSAFTKIAA